MYHLYYLNKYLWKYKTRLLIGFCFIIIANIFGLAPAQIIRRSFDLIEKSIIRHRTNYGKIIDDLNGNLETKSYGQFIRWIRLCFF